MARTMVLEFWNLQTSKVLKIPKITNGSWRLGILISQIPKQFGDFWNFLNFSYSKGWSWVGDSMGKKLGGCGGGGGVYRCVVRYRGYTYIYIYTCIYRKDIQGYRGLVAFTYIIYVYMSIYLSIYLSICIDIYIYRYVYVYVIPLCIQGAPWDPPFYWVKR